MKKLIALAAIAALAACGERAADAPAAEETTTGDAFAVDPAATAWTGFEPGSYTVTGADGEKTDFVLTADGYTATTADGKTATGSLVMRDGKGCMTPVDGKEMCWTNAKPGADGSWVATSDSGEKSTVTKKAA